MWEWDGVSRTWSAGPPGPPARAGAALAYDRVHKEIVLFGGGLRNGAVFGDTWSLTAAHGWTLKSPATSPSARIGAAMAWNPVRERIVLFGGQTGGASSVVPEQDTWEWDGTTWTELPIVPPPPRAGAVLLGARDGVTLFGGTELFGAPVGQLEDIWLLRFDGIHASEGCRENTDDDGDGLKGCADPDCWFECTPLCLPGDTCPMPPPSPSCGDGVCGSNETDDLCPTDCATVTCGDGECSASDCPGDCPGP